MKRSLDSLKNAFTKKAGGTGDQSWKLFYPFWKMADDTVAVIRFLPDLDEENSLGFLVENLQHELIVNGEKKRVACLQMHGENCPICELSRQYYDQKDDVLGKKYYKKKSYIGQILVIESPIEHDQNQLVKLIDFGPAIFKQIQSAFQSGDLEEAPFELKGGYNFRIKKTKSGQYASYTTSSFAPKQTDLDDELIEKLELYNLKDYRAEYVSREVMEAMLAADQTGQSYDSDDSDDSSDSNSTTSTPAETTKAEPAKAEAPKTESSGGGKAQAILEQLRSRAKAAQAE